MALLTQTIRNTAVYALGNFAVRLVGLILIPFLTNTTYLSVEGFGAFSILELLIQLFMSLMGLGIYMGFSRFYWDNRYADDQKGMFTLALGLTLLASILVGVVVWFFAPVLHHVLFPNGNYVWALKMATLSAALQAFLLVPHTLLKLQSKSGFFSGINGVRAITTLGFTYLLVIYNRTGLNGLYEAQVLSMLLTVLCTLPLVVKNFDSKLDPHLAKSLTSYSIPLMVSSVLVLLLGALDRFVLNSVSGLENVAVYSLGFKLSNSIKVFIVTSIQLALSPILMKKMNDDDHGEFYNEVLQIFSATLMFVILGVSLFAKELIALFTVEQVYESAYLVVVLLALGFYFDMVKDNVIIGLNIRKKTLLSGAISFVAAVLGLVLYRLFVPKWGIYGAASAFVGVQFLYFLMVYFAAQKVHYIRFQIGRVLGILLVGVALFGLSWLVKDAVVWANLLIKILLLLGYPVLMYGFNLVAVSHIHQLKNMLRKNTTSNS